MRRAWGELWCRGGGEILNWRRRVDKMRGGIQNQKQQYKMGNYKERLAKINTFVFDYDGVLSDGNVWLVSPELQIRSANVKDGYALHHAVKKGFNVAIISGGTGEVIRQRMEFLGVKDVFLQVAYKREKFFEYINQKGVLAENVLFMGDDIPDLELMQIAGIATCPIDAVHEIREKAHYISSYKGGRGCVRDVVEQVMRAQNIWLDEAALHW